MSTLATPTRIYVGDSPALRGDVEIEQHVETLWSDLPRPNPSWKYTDQQGHEHVYAMDGERFTTPTLNVEYEHVNCDGSCGDSGCEGYNISHYSCRVCGEEIKPGLLHAPHSIAIPLGRSWTVNVHAMIGQINDEFPVRITRESVTLMGTARVIEQSRTSEIGGGSTAQTRLVGVSELAEQ